jgi:hypothetical protein
LSRWTRLALLAVVTLATPSCQLLDWVQDRARNCERVQIDLVNRSLVAQPVNIAIDSESYADANLLRAGQTRQVTECVEEGNRKRFRAGRGGVTLDIVNCVVMREDFEREFERARVVWDNERLYCENW